MLRFEELPHSRRCNAGLLTFFHQTNYGRFVPVNNAIINFNKYCHWFDFCGELGRDMFQDGGSAFRSSAFAIIYHDV
jgi:hypothetical protein